MRDAPSLRTVVETARTKHDAMSDDRRRGDGRLGDDELLALLLVPYPTLVGQRN
jgi:hypothetical protein